MGLEVLEEFRPVKPLRTVQLTSRSGLINHGQAQEISADLNKTREEDVLHWDEEDCHTPKSAASVLKSTLVCPPAPKKPRPPRRKLSFPPQGFFEVPQDLSSVYIELKRPNFKKIRAT